MSEILRRKINVLISIFVLAMILASLFTQFILHLSASFAAVPLWAALAIGGTIFVIDLAAALLRGEWGADVLAAVAVITSCILGEYMAGAIIVLMLFGGRTLEDNAIRSASSVLSALAKRMPSVAHRRAGAGWTDVDTRQVAIGDILAVHPHEACPVDGTVVEGHGTMDEAYLTGEPFQTEKAPGSFVLSGAVNGESLLTIRATRLAVDSRYEKIVQVMRTTEENKPRMRRLAERIGAIYTPLALAAAVGAWWVSGDPTRFLSVLVIATPCPLLIGIPVAIIGAISLAARRGIIIKQASVLELIGTCETAIFDKTGTLTCGEPELTETIAAPGVVEKEMLGLAASLERYSKHPLALAILKAARKESVSLLEASEIGEIPGRGLRGSIAGRRVEIVGRGMLKESGFLGLEHVPPIESGLECLVIVDGRYAATLRFRDTPRAESSSFIRHLGPKHKLKRAMIISGDRESEVRYLAELVGIKEIYAGQSPEEKLTLVRAQTAKAKTFYVGDGINDAPALMTATVGVAIGRNSDITSQAAGAVILDSSLAKVDELLHIGKRMRMIALQSAGGGIALSLVGMAWAAAGYLSPVQGALLQEAIDLFAVLNALRAAFPPQKITDFS